MAKNRLFVETFPAIPKEVFLSFHNLTKKVKKIAVYKIYQQIYIPFKRTISVSSLGPYITKVYS